MHGNVTTITPAKPPVEDKYRTVTLTNRAPIRIKEDEWPIIGEGGTGSGPDIPDEWSWEIKFVVRHSKYGHRLGIHDRILIHAVYVKNDENDEKYQKVRVGRLLKDNAIFHLWKNMLEVADEMRERILDEKLCRFVTHALDNCFANLKPIENY